MVNVLDLGGVMVNVLDLGGVMVNVLDSIAIDRGFDHRSRKSKDYIKLIIVVSLLSTHLQGG